MLCPRCKELIEYDDITVERDEQPVDQRSAYFIISIFCSGCDQQYSHRVEQSDLKWC